ncbi:phosphomannomutase/phosphoglucomutase [Cellulomonas soli]|uniref:phosphomannomutase/phosphoglucomutase n=1 Tax=Cellulomonas soli TaxID=931535 RepID=UPI003F83FF77
MTPDVPRADPRAPAPDDGASRGVPGAVPEQPDPASVRASALRLLVDLGHIRPVTLVLESDAVTADAVQAALGTVAGFAAPPVELVLLPTPGDGDTGVGESRLEPVDRRDLRDLGAAVLLHGADLGVAVDPSTGWCAVVDERGEPVSPSVTAAVVGLREVTRERQAGRTPTVVHSLLTSHAVPDLLGAAGARTVPAPAAGSAVAAQVTARDAVYGADHDGHHVFRAVPAADGALLAALHVLAAVGEQEHPLSTVAELYQPYVSSGEITSRVGDVAAARARVVQAYVEQRGGGPVDVDELDGLTVSHWGGHPQWSFSLRTSTAESLVRLTVEAADEDMMVKVRDDVLALVRSDEEN